MTMTAQESRAYAAEAQHTTNESIALVVHSEDDNAVDMDDADEDLVHDGELLGPNMDPFACLCCCKLKRLGQSYVLRDRRVLRDGKLERSLLLVGPHWIGVVITLSIIVGSTALFLAQQGPHMAWYLVLITLCFCGFTLYYLFLVSCTDPGIVRRPRQRASIKKSVPDKAKVATDVEEGDDGRETLAVEDEEEEPATVRRTPRSSSVQRLVSEPRDRRSASSHRRRYCDICDVEQPRNAEHCDDCGVCIDGYDHHCPWMGKCIGRDNLHAFKLFNIAWVLYVVFVLGVSIQNADWTDAAVERLHRLSNGQWVRDSP